MHRFLGTVEEIATLDTVKLMVVVGWITAIPFEEWGQQKPHGVLPLKPAMMSNRTWFNMGEATDPLVHDVLSGHYPGCIAQQAMLGVVMPGDHIPPHVDHQCPEWVERIHIPLTTNKACSFVCGGVEHHMEVGKAYRVNTEAVHAVYNRGWVPRVHFMFDVRT